MFFFFFLRNAFHTNPFGESKRKFFDINVIVYTLKYFLDFFLEFSAMFLLLVFFLFLVKNMRNKIFSKLNYRKKREKVSKFAKFEMVHPKRRNVQKLKILTPLLDSSTYKSTENKLQKCRMQEFMYACKDLNSIDQFCKPIVLQSRWQQSSPLWYFNSYTTFPASYFPSDTLESWKLAKIF